MRLYSNSANQFPGLALSPMKVTGRFWRKGEDKSQLPDRDYFVQQCGEVGPLCINVEHWRWDIRKDPASVVDESLRKLITLSRWAIEAFPSRVIGHYSIFPLRDYRTPQLSKLLHPIRWAKWRRANGYVKRIRESNGRYSSIGLADVCHVTMPSLYTFYDNPAGWARYAKANLYEGRKYGKPDVPFIWPRYHGSNKELGLSGIDAEYWTLQLDTLKAAGVREAVIWDSAAYFARKGCEEWTEQTPWIQATREWMAA